MIKKYFLYLIRWQLSSPILAGCLFYLHFGVTWNTVIANLIGGLIFFWVDKFIFTAKILNPTWELKFNQVCVDCGIESTCYRLVKSKNYDKVHDPNPKWRCEKCRDKKLELLKEDGIVVD